MNSAERSSPMRLAAWAGFGSVLFVSPVLFKFLRLLQSSTHEVSQFAALSAWPLRLFVVGVPSLIGLGIALMAAQKLRGDVKKSAWTDAELDPLRRRLRNPVLILMLTALVVLGIGLVVTSHGFDHAGYFCFLIMPFQIWSQIAQAVRPVDGSQERIDWNGSAAIRSEHWGEPPSGTVG
jgi:hypothetical protein